MEAQCSVRFARSESFFKALHTCYVGAFFNCLADNVVLLPGTKDDRRKQWLYTLKNYNPTDPFTILEPREHGVKQNARNQRL